MDYASLGKSPISEDRPAGDDCRYEAEFETLQAEIDKLSLPTAEGDVDWSKVVSIAADILQQQSKDLTVAAYLAVGLVKNHQMQGLDQGLAILQDLVALHWDHLYPSKKRMRGRVGALNWWTEKTGETLSQTKYSPIPEELARRLAGHIESLDQHLADKLPQPLSLGPLERALAAIPVKKAPAAKKPAAAADAAPEPAAKDRAPSPAAAAPAPPPVQDAASATAGDPDVQKRIEAALQNLRQPSLVMLQQDLTNPLAYRYRRIACWAALTELPPHADGATRIPAPPPQLANELAAQQEAGNWPALIQNCEQKISQYIFWFDLHFLVAEGLKHLGASHRAALDEVCRQAGYLQQSFPSIEQLAFADGTPFADARTRKWLKRTGFGRGGGMAAAGEDEPDAQLEGRTSEALALARRKRLADALGLLQDGMQRAASRRGQMLWRMAIIRVLLAVKKYPLALPHIEQVLSDIETFQLEDWDPDMALSALTVAWKGFNAHGGNEYQKRGADILNRIAARFPAQALGIGR